MTGVAGYILTVTAAAMLTAVLRHLAGKGAMGTMIRFLCGLFLALTILTPLLKLELPDLNDLFGTIQYDGRDAAAFGEDMADEAMRGLIKERVEAYILDKAALYGAVLTADVTLDRDGIPVSVTLAGNVSADVRAALGRWMTEELGLKEEMQHWTG